jgi:hypothetical protein
MRDSQSGQWVSDAIVRQAQFDAERYSIPKYVYQSWRMKYHDAKARGIEFTFTLMQWRLWWMFELRMKGHDAKRGRGIGKYMMCRIGDVGPYTPDNVYCGTAKENAADTKRHYDHAAAARLWHATHDSHLKGKRGDAHPKSRAVLTPRRYGSIALASEAHGITRQAGFHRIKAGVWSYESLLRSP